MDDKELERLRYDGRAKKTRERSQPESGAKCGVASVRNVFNSPYVFYDSLLVQVLKPDLVVLEIGSGTGEFTEVLLRSGANVIASDISAESLELLRITYSNYNKLQIYNCDMEHLPFADETFDVITSAGSLSYGDNKLVMHHIQRLLKPGGYFVCVDTLNHNPLYRLNRYLRYLKGERTRSTLMRMPTVELISNYISALGGPSNVKYFGSVSWLMGPLSHFCNEEWLSDLSDRIDRLFRIRKSAFKFVLIVKKAV